MTPERSARLVAQWVRLYTQDLPAPIAERRTGEIGADLHDHIEHERARGTSERWIALSILSRMVRGLPADGSWRAHQAKPATDRPSTLKETMTKNRTAYRSGLGLALATSLMLRWAMGAVGIIGTEGDSADLMYLGVLGVGIVGAIAARFRPHGMARAAGDRVRLRGGGRDRADRRQAPVADQLGVGDPRAERDVRHALLRLGLAVQARRA